MHHFLATLAENLVAHQEPLQQQLVVLPTRRAAYHLKRIFAERLNHEGWLPELITLNTWCERVAGVKNADRLQLKFVCYEAYKQVLGSAAQDISLFFAWADTLLDDFNDIESQGINPAVIFKELKDYNEISHFSFLDEDLSDRQKRYREFWRSLKDIHKHFNEKLAAAGMSYPGLTARLAAERCEEYLSQNPNQLITFAGFNALSNSESDLIKAIQDQGQGSLYFDTDPAWLDDLDNHAGLFIRRKLRQGIGKALANAESMAMRPLEVTYSEARNKAAQADAVAALIAQLEPGELSTTVLVLADEGMLIPVLNRLPPSVTQANVTMGLSLGQSALSDWLEKLFSLHERINRDSTGIYMLSSKLKALVVHPLSNILSAGATAPKVELQSLYMDLGAFRQNVQDARWHWLLPLLSDWQHATSEAIEDLNAFCKIAIERMDQVSYSSLEVRMTGDGLATLKRLLDKLGQIPQIALLKPLALGGILQDGLRSAKINLIGEPAVGLQIMGLLESRALGYPRVIICDANEDVLPGSAHFESFIPFEIRAYHNMPGKREKEAVYANHFYRLLHHAEHMHLVYHVDTSGPWGAEPSRYLKQLSHHLSEKLPQLLVKALPLQEPPSVRATRNLRIAKSEEVLKNIKLYISNRLSASGINRYLESSLEWYYENVLRLASPEDEGLLDVAAFGTIVHACLEQLYLDTGLNKMLIDKDLEIMRGKAAAQLTACFQQSSRIAQFDKGINRLHFEAAKSMIMTHLNTELGQIKQGDEVIVLGTELRLSRKLKLVLHGEQVEANFVGSADLVIRRNQVLRVIDFKTGTVRPEDLNLKISDAKSYKKKPKALQLSLYAWMARAHYGEEAVEAQIISLPKARNTELMLAIPMKSPEDESLFESVLQEVLSEMLDPEMPLQANPDFKWAKFEPA